jgi:serine protease AprX
MKRHFGRSFASAAMVCAAAGLPVSAQVAGHHPDAIQHAQHGQQRIALPNGAVVHSTNNAVMLRQTIELPDGGVLVTWSELEGGAATPYFAYSLDGRNVAGRVMQNELTIGLRYAAFDPLAGEPVVDARLRSGAGSEVRLVQFHATALPAMQEALAGAGAEILRFVGNNTMIVRMTPGASERVRALPFVRWEGAFHTAYKLDEAVLAEVLGQVPEQAEARYSIECFDRGMAAQQAVARKVVALGGIVEIFTPDAFRMEATLTPAQLLEIARMDEVHFIDPWGGPGGTDTNLVRQLGGANFLQTTAGFTGQGVRGEIFDTELRTTHTEFTVITPLIHSTGTTGSAHGTSCFSINFARGASANARGILPDAEEGIFYRYSESTQFGGTKTRLAINQELINPAGPYRAVFQTSSVGSTQTTAYTTVSQEVDDYLFITKLLSTQSQSNTSNQNSRPQAWAKNIVSGGAVNHFNNATRSAHQWASTASSCGSGGSASIGPAADGRVKPDLCFFYDCTFAASSASNTSYTEFGGTSGATPSIAGYFGLFFQMWHEGVWAGRGGGSSVFASRAKMMTAKAALINSAYRYTWTAGGPNASLTRAVQGWGMPDVQNLHNMRNKTFIVDEEDVILPLQVKSYQILVTAGEPNLAVTMAYADRAGTTSSTTHRINDLSLKVISPTGTVYWGNNGLTAGNFSTSGGASNTKDTVENVFLANPAAGVWTVQVSGDAIVQDTHPATPAIDADFALWVTGGVKYAPAGTMGPVLANPSQGYATIANAAVAGSSGLNTLTRDLPRTYQTVIAASELTYLEPGSRITGMTFRPHTGAAANWPTAPASWSDYSVQIASATNGPGSMSSTFASNVGADAVQVRSGGLTIPAGAFKNDGISPRAFGQVIAFDRPFQYKGGDLVVTVRHSGNNSGTNQFMDSVNPSAQMSAQYAESATATTASATNSTATVIRFMTEPGEVAPSGFANTGGNGGLNSPIQTGGRTVQMIVGAQHLTHIRPHSTLDGIAFRPQSGSSNWPSAGPANFNDYRIEIGNSAVAPGSMSSTVAANHGANVILARTGPLSFPQNVATGGASVNPFGVVVPFQRKFVYTGGDVVVTLRHDGSSAAAVFLDTVSGAPNMALRYETNATATTTTLSNAPLATLFLATPSSTAPKAYGMAQPPTTGGNSASIFNSPAVYQLLFSGSELSHIPAGSLINGLTWRVSSSVAGQSSWPAMPAEFTQYDVELSKPATTAGTMSTTYASNMGTGVSLVRSGPLVIPTNAFPGGASSTELNEFGQFITFDRPYAYTGGDLLVTIRHSGQSQTPRFMDGLLNGGPGYGVVGAAVISTGSASATSGSLGRLITTRFSYTPAGGPSCYANCDGSTTPPILNVADFTCFLSKFAALDPYANCDGSTVPPVHNVADFTCFLSKFAAGC